MIFKVILPDNYHHIPAEFTSYFPSSVADGIQPYLQWISSSPICSDTWWMNEMQNVNVSKSQQKLQYYIMKFYRNIWNNHHQANIIHRTVFNFSHQHTGSAEGMLKVCQVNISFGICKIKKKTSEYAYLPHTM